MRRLLLALALLAAPVAAQNLGEIATTGDDYSVATEPFDDKLLLDFALVPPYQQYQIDHPPGTCAFCDDFDGDAAALTWRWGNQSGASEAYETEVAHFSAEVSAGTEAHARWTTGPDGSATDWVMVAKVSAIFGGLSEGVGIALLATGDETTPTKIYVCNSEHHGGSAVLGQRNLTVSIWNNYTSFNSNPTQYVRVSDRWGPIYLRMRYVSSTKGFYCAISDEGVLWQETAVQTLAAHPTTSMGYWLAKSTIANDLWVWWWRVRTDSGGTTAPYPMGE